RLAIRLDHDRQLDQAGRRHRLVGFVAERLARFEMFYRDRDVSFVSRDEGRQSRAQRLSRGGGGQEQQTEVEEAFHISGQQMELGLALAATLWIDFSSSATL